jgi:hypothetical protein
MTTDAMFYNTLIRQRPILGTILSLSFWKSAPTAVPKENSEVKQFNIRAPFLYVCKDAKETLCYNFFKLFTAQREMNESASLDNETE